MAFISQLPIYQDQNTDPNINPQGAMLPTPSPNDPNPYNGNSQGFLSQASKQSPYVNAGFSGKSNMIPQGIDKSWVEGYLASKQLDFATDTNARANSTQSMNEEKFSWDKYTTERQFAIQSGMSDAANKGGFSAVIDYLQNAAPDLALHLQQEKTTLDKSMMENETYKTTHQNDKSLVMLQGYQMLGGLGATLLKTDPSKREATYQALLPVAKQIDPNLPDTLDLNAMSKLALGMSLSTPAAILYDNGKKTMQYKSEIGQLMNDHAISVAQYGENSPEAQLLAKSVQDKSSYLNRLELQTANTIAANQRSGENNLRNQWLNITKDISQMAQSNSAIQKTTKSANNPDGTIKGPDDMATIYNYYKILDPTSVIMPGEYANADNTKGWSDSMKVQYNKIRNGDKLSDRQREAFAKSAQDLLENKMQSYYSLQSQFRDIAKKSNYNPDNIIVDRVGGYLPKPPDKAIEFLKQNPSPELQKQFQLKYGQDALNQILGENSGQ